MGAKILAHDCGIYAIVSKCGQYVYVGQSIHMRQRKSQHMSKLLAGKHYNTHLQRCFDKYGQESFEFVILEACEKSALVEREQYWIDQQRGKTLLNCAPVAVSPGGIPKSKESIRKRLEKMAGYRPSEETKEKMRAAHLARREITKAKTIEQMKDPLQRIKAGSGRRGKKLTDEHKAKVAETSKQRWADPAYKERLSEIQKIVHARRREQYSAVMKEKWASPDYRNMMLAANKRKLER